MAGRQVIKPELKQITNYVGAAVAVVGNVLPLLTPELLAAVGVAPATVRAVSSVAAALLILYREKTPAPVAPLPPELPK